MAPREASSAARFARAAALAAAVGVASAQTWVAPNSNYPKGCVPNPFPSAGGYVSNPNAVGTFYADGSFDTNLVNTSNVRGYAAYANPGLATALATATSGQCYHMEDAFEEGFQLPALNLTRWKDITATALDHCPTPGAVGAANAATCTAMMASQIQLGVPLPGYPTGDLGAILTLSQTPCATNQACCSGSVCANWAGAHLSSRGCILYGVLEAEAAFNMPIASGAIGFFGTYMYGGAPDPSWNEVDQTFVNGANGLEFHASLFISNPGNPSNAQEDKDVFDSTGVNCNSYAPPAGQPGNLKGTLTPYTCPVMTTQKASSFHTYKLVWTPTWIAWLVDNITYRNSTSSPWRPVTMRPLLRTNVGTARSVAVLPDATIYLRRIRYTPLTPAAPGTPGYPGYMPHWLDPVVTAALSCSSMAACFGSLSSAAAGMIQMANGGSGGAAAGRRRRGRALLQGAGPVLECVNGTCAETSSDGTYTPTNYQMEVDGNNTVLPSQVAVTITSHTLTATTFLYGIPFSAWTTQMQNTFVAGIATDVIPTPDQVYITSVVDAAATPNWCNAAQDDACGNPYTYDYPYPLGALCPNGTALTATQQLQYPNGIGSCAAANCAPGELHCNYAVYTNVFTSTCNGVVNTGCKNFPLSGPFAYGGGMATLAPLRGILVTYVVDGYSCALYTNGSACTDGGYSLAASDAAVLNSLASGVNGVGGSATYQALFQALASGPAVPHMNLSLFGVTDESFGTVGNEGLPAISYVATISINVDGQALVATTNSTRTDTLEALLNSAVNSGTLNAALMANNYTATSSTNVQTQRNTRQTTTKTGCPVCQEPQPLELVCADQINQTALYRDVAIAFVVATGCLVLGFFAAMAVFAVQLRTARARASAARKSIPGFAADN